MSLSFNIKKRLLISGAFFALGILFISLIELGIFWQKEIQTADAASGDNLRGWGWSENIGWISMNCYNDYDNDGDFENCCLGGNLQDCPYGLSGGTYGVKYDTTYDKLKGWGWSENAGWICFGETCQQVCLGGTNNGAACTSTANCLPGGVCGGQPPEGLPLSWACVGYAGWHCDGGDRDGLSCYSTSTDCPSGTCIFGCSGDAGEDFVDSGVCVQSAHLKAHWKLNDISAGTIADEVNNNTGVLMPINTPPIQIKGRFDNALKFDGIEDYIEINDSPSLSVIGNLTIEAWIKRGDVDREQTIVAKWDESTGKKSYRLWFDVNNELNFSLYENGMEINTKQKNGICVGNNRKICDGGTRNGLTCYYYNNTTECPDGVCREPYCESDADCITGEVCKNAPIVDLTKWHHIAGKYVAATSANSASVHIFIDGSEVAANIPTAIPSSLTDENEKVYLGAKKATSIMNTYFKGSLDNVSIWSCQNVDKIFGRNNKEIWEDAKIELDGWARVISLGERGWLKLKGFTKDGRVWGSSLNDYNTFYIFNGYMANRWVDEDVITDGLVAYWKFNEPNFTTSTTIIDSSGNNNNGIPQNGVMITSKGIFSNAADFDGTNDYISVSDSSTLDFDAAESFSFVYWIYPQDFTQWFTPIAKRQSGAGYEMGIDSNGVISWYLNNGSVGFADTPDTDSLELNQWSQVALVFDRNYGTAKRYLNGEQTGTIDSITAVGDISNTLNLSIGGRSLRGDGWFYGFIDNTAIYNRALLPAEILNLYQRSTPHCIGWEDYEHDYDDPPEPLEFDNLEANNTQGCDQLLVQWDVADWAESYTYWKCDDTISSDCVSCSYVENSVLDDSCDLSGCALSDSGLIANTGYCYKIQAHNESGDTWNSEGPIWKSTLLCAPESGEVDSATCGQLEIEWTTVENSDGYNVYRSLTPTGCSELYNSDCELTSHLAEAMDYDADNDAFYDLIAQWKMNESSWTGSSGEVHDSSGNANHGVASSGLTTSEGKFSLGGLFNGIDNYLDVGTNETLEAPTITIEAWVKRTGIGTRDAILVDNKISADGEDHYLWFEIGADNKLALIFGDGANPGTKYSTGTIADLNWHHVAVVRDDLNKTVKFYLDGEPETAQSYAGLGELIILDEDNLWIGKSNVASNTSPFYGRIDNLAVYNVAKTDAQIKIDYEAGSCGGASNCQLTEICHVAGIADGHCGKIQSDADTCCYTDSRIIPYIDYYYVMTATSEQGESASGPATPLTANTICFPPQQEQEQ